METRCSKVIFPNDSKQKPAEDFTLLLYAAELALFTLKIVNTLIKNSSRDDRPSIST